MPVDATIPLDFDPTKQYGPDVQKIMGQTLTLRALAQKMQIQNQAIAGQNAMKSIFANPASIDPATGMIRPEAVRSVMAVDPATGMELQKTNYQTQAQQAASQLRQTEIGQKKHDFTSSLAGESKDAYDAAIAAGKSKDDATNAAVQVRNDGLRANGGILNDQEVDSAMRSPFNPDQASYYAMTNKDYAAQQDRKQALDRADKSESEREKHDEALEKLAAARGDRDPTATKWQVLNDPKTNESYRYNPETAQSTTLDGKPYVPQGAAKMGGGAAASGAPASVALKKFLEEKPDATSAEIDDFIQKTRAPRSPAAATIAQFMKENPDATAEQISQENAHIRSEAAASQAFGTGKQGDTTRSLNVSVKHLDVLKDLGDALKNGDTKAINAVGNRLKTEFGDPAANNFDLARSIVGDEVEKAVKGGVGTGAEREALQARFSNANSPAALAGVIDTAQKLLGGQLLGLEQQYKVSTKKGDFRDALFPETVKALGADGPPGAATPAAPSSGKIIKYDADGNPL